MNQMSIGFLIGFIAFPVVMTVLSVMFRKSGTLVGYAKTPEEAADKLMPLINSNDALRKEIKNRLGV